MSEIYKELQASLLEGDDDQVIELCGQVVSQGLDAAKALNALIESIGQVGDKFGAGEIFLPELMLAGEAMNAAMGILIPAIPAAEARQSAGTFVIGTVRGDLHDIGKNIVKSFLQASGFKVIDLGIDVPASKFAEEAQKVKADIVGVSAVLTTTATGLRDVVEYFQAVNIRDKHKIMIGGSATDQALADVIGADAWSKDAAEAVVVAKKILA